MLPGIVEGTDTLCFVVKEQIPKDRLKDAVHVRIVCNERPEKEDPDRVRITAAGNHINYPGDFGTPTADLLTVKLLLNSIISIAGTKFFTMDISNFYLNTPLKRKEYLRLKITNFPENIINNYTYILRQLATHYG